VNRVLEAPRDVDSDLATQNRNQAIRLSLAGRFAESEVLSREALRLRPDDVDILNELGVAVWRQGRLAEAEEIFLKARAIKADDFRVLTNLGLTIYQLNRIEEAGELYRQAIALQPKAFDAIMNLGVVLSDTGKFVEATHWLEAARQLRPDSADALVNVGMNLARQGALQQAITLYEQAIAIQPDFLEGHLNLSYALLSLGEYERGWVEYEWRLKVRPHVGARINRTFWNGDDLRGMTILLHFEQGFGDTLQFIRYAPLVKRKNGQVIVLCPAPLLELIARCEGVDMAFDGSSYQPNCHVHAPLLSLPSIFGTTLGTVPARVPYLHINPILAERWRGELAPLRANGPATEGATAKPLLIGIAWQGNPEQRGDRWRSIPLTAFKPLANVPGVKLISLQTTHGLDQLKSPDRTFPVIELTGRRGRDFSESAAIMRQLDLVITPDTAVAHLAGGLGVPVWMGLSAIGDWRYPHGRSDNPWYPTMRVYRQDKLADWNSVLGRMAEDLRQRLAG
jgi:tetratricopeptide (TPR) repeat protein